MLARIRPYTYFCRVGSARYTRLIMTLRNMMIIRAHLAASFIIRTPPLKYPSAYALIFSLLLARFSFLVLLINAALFNYKIDN